MTEEVSSETPTAITFQFSYADALAFSGCGLFFTYSLAELAATIANKDGYRTGYKIVGMLVNMSGSALLVGFGVLEHIIPMYAVMSGVAIANLIAVGVALGFKWRDHRRQIENNRLY
jgi:hypothetical protein